MDPHTELGTVLITGGSGFLGTHIVQQLLSRNVTSHIAILSRSPRKPGTATSFFPHDNALEGSGPRHHVSYQSADISSPKAISSIFDQVQPDVVFHIAAAKSSARAPEQERTNVTGTQTMLCAATDCTKTKVFIYTSSNAALHPTGTKCLSSEDEAVLWTKKDRECGAYTSYGRSKALADSAVRAANSARLKTVALRVPIIHGEGSPMIESVANSIRQKQENVQIGDNTNMFEFVYAGNAAHAHILAAQALVSEPNNAGVGGQAFHITDGIPLPFWDFWRKCCESAGHPVNSAAVKIMPFWFLKGFASLGEWVVWAVTLGRGKRGFGVTRAEVDYLDEGIWWNIERARKVLGYAPIVSMDEGIRKGMAWGMRENK